MASAYSSVTEAEKVLGLVLDAFQRDTDSLPEEVRRRKHNVHFSARRDLLYFPVPLKETETAAALKAVEGSVAAAIADLKAGRPDPPARNVRVDLEKATGFLMQAYLATVGGLGKFGPGVRRLLKDTDLLQAQSDKYRRLSANLYETKRPGEYYHIHGSLEASTTLRMIGLEPFRPDLTTHEEIVGVIEPAVKRHTVDELEALNAANKQAGVMTLTFDEFLQSPHGKTMSALPPWTVEPLETGTPPAPLPETKRGKILSGIRVLELCRIIAGPVITRILAEYGADVLKITSPHLSDVPFFQVDGNMGKHAAELDLRTTEGRHQFEALLADVDVVVDGYRPGAFDRLGYGPQALSEMATKRGRGIVYVNENCFGHQGEWAGRAGWQQIADCVSGVAWAQGRFMKLQEPVVPPFPLSDYGTGCMGAIAALTGLYHRATRGGSWHGRTSLLQYDLLLQRAGLLPEDVQEQLRTLAGPEFMALRHSNSVDQIGGAALATLGRHFPDLFTPGSSVLCQRWHSAAYRAEVVVVGPAADVDGVSVGFERASRPNGTDVATWEFGDDEGDKRL